jgi:hypothetical protein
MLASHADDARRHAGVEIAIEGNRELGLRAVALDDAANRCQTGKRLTDQFVAVTHAQRASSITPCSHSSKGGC